LISLVALLAFAFILAVRRTRQGVESKQSVSRWTGLAAALVAVWLGGSAALAASGLLMEFDRRPPPFLLFAGGFTIATAVVAFSPLGTRVVRGSRIGWLIGFQSFRIPVELWLHRLYQEGVVPVQMTYEGRNYDIVSGILGLVLFLWAIRREPPRWAIWTFNLVGLALLVNIVAIAMLSAPTPLRHFFNEPANTFVAYVPYVWLPAFLVQAAWFGHLLVFRWLRQSPSKF
jgi:hypothetical protein